MNAPARPYVDFDARFCFTGSRAFTDHVLVSSLCLGLARELSHKRVLFAQGGALGLDSLVRQWYRAVRPSNVELVTFQADWTKFGAAAGPVRNRNMLDLVHPHILFAFDGGRGTWDCTNAAIKKGITVVAVPSLQRITKPETRI